MTKNPTDNRYQMKKAAARELSRRGILHQAERAGWHSWQYRGGAGWRYPVYNLEGNIIAYRWKAENAAQQQRAGMKYVWIGGKPDEPAADWYLAPTIRQHIADAGGVAYLANGEPARLAMEAAGVPNVIATTLSEVSTPGSTIETLKALGVAELRYPADKDDAGRNSAMKWRKALDGSGITFVPLNLPDKLPHKADLNDLWRWVAFQPDVFRRELQALRALLLPSDETPMQARNIDDSHIDETPGGLVDALAAALGVQGFKQNGFSRRNVQCPHHEDENPSAGLSEDGVLNCFVCGSHSPQATAERLGIDWRAFYPRRTRQQKPSKALDLAAVPGEDRMSSWARQVDRPAYNAQQRVNLRYISQLDTQQLTQPTILVKSSLGSGKTELARRIIAAADERNGSAARVLVITHLQALARNIAQRLAMECYKDIPGDYIKSVPRLVISFDSLHRLEDVHTYDLVIVDEMEQFTRHLWGGTMNGNEPRRAYETLSRIIADCGQFIGLDAHMSDISRRWLQFKRGSVHAIDNEHRPQRGALTLSSSEAALIRNALAAAENAPAGKPIVIISNSKKRTEIYEQLFTARWNADEVMVINGDTSGAAEQQQFIRQINDKLPGVKILIASPSLGTGIDVQAPVAAVFGVFLRNRWGNAESIMQAVMRFRNADNYSAFVSISTGDEITDWRKIQQRHIDRARWGALSAEYNKYGLEDVDPVDREILRLFALHTAQSAAQRNDLFSHVVALAKLEGFSINYVDSFCEHTHEAIKAAREAAKEAERQRVLNAEIVTPDELRAMREIGQADKEAQAGVVRYFIEYTAGQEITPDLYDLLHSSRQRRAFNRFVDMHDDERNLQAKDRAQADSLVFKRTWHTREMQIIRAGIESVFGTACINSDERVTEGDIAARMESFLDLHMPEIQAFIDSRAGLSTKPINILRRLLSAVSLKLAWARPMSGGVRGRVFFIDAETREEMSELARIALAARRQRREEYDCPHSYNATYAHTNLGNAAPAGADRAGAEPPGSSKTAKNSDLDKIPL